MSRYYIERETSYPPHSVLLPSNSFLSTSPSLLPIPNFCPLQSSLPLLYHLIPPPWTLSSSSSSPCLPLFPPSFLSLLFPFFVCSFSLHFHSSHFPLRSPHHLSCHLKPTACPDEPSQLDLNSVDENVPTFAWLCVNVDLSFVESLIILSTTILKTHDGST